jgi:hypothetical protein
MINRPLGGQCQRKELCVWFVLSSKFLSQGFGMRLPWESHLRQLRCPYELALNILRALFGPAWDGVRTVVPRLYHDLIRSVFDCGSVVYAGHVARMGEKNKSYTVLVGKPDGKSH